MIKFRSKRPEWHEIFHSDWVVMNIEAFMIPMLNLNGPPSKLPMKSQPHHLVESFTTCRKIPLGQKSPRQSASQTSITAFNPPSNPTAPIRASTVSASVRGAMTLSTTTVSRLMNPSIPFKVQILWGVSSVAYCCMRLYPSTIPKPISNPIISKIWKMLWWGWVIQCLIYGLRWCVSLRHDLYGSLSLRSEAKTQ